MSYISLLWNVRRTSAVDRFTKPIGSQKLLFFGIVRLYWSFVLFVCIVAFPSQVCN